MEFRDLKMQYRVLKDDIQSAIETVLQDANYISGKQVVELEQRLAQYVGAKHCITCANGTDALSVALMAWDIGPGDAVFVPDFTFFASGEVVSLAGATPVFVDIDRDTFNISSTSLEEAINKVLEEGQLAPKVVITVDLFGQPADYDSIVSIAKRYSLKLLEDSAQGFGGSIRGKRACSFGDISTTSFFPAKPLGCYGDGGAIFTDDDRIAALIRSLCIHGKGNDKYDNVRVGMNSRLDTIQAAILQVKLKAFMEYEVEDINRIADRYTENLKDLVITPMVNEGYYSSWAQYSILLKDKTQRDLLQSRLKRCNIPSMIYYSKPMHKQTAFEMVDCVKVDLSVTADVCDRILALPIHPYLTEEEQNLVITEIKEFISNYKEQ